MDKYIIRMVFSLTAEKDDMIDWKKIQGEVEKRFGTKVYYTRYNRAEKGGHLILNKHKTTEAKQLEVFSNIIKYISLID